MAESEQDGSSRSSSRGSSFSLCHMTESAYAKVIFCEIHDSYSVDSDVECLYQLSESIVPHSDDCIGLYRVGRHDLEDCIASVSCGSAVRNASLAGDSYNKILFKVKDLPKDDMEYYQFLYLTGDHEICGASTPFKFHNVHENENVVVLSSEHDFLEVKTSTSLLQNRLADTQKYVAFLEKAKKELEDKIVGMEEEKVELEEKLKNIEKEKNNAEQKLLEFNKSSEETGLRKDLQSLAEKTQRLLELPDHTEHFNAQISNMKDKIESLSKDNSSLKARNSILKNDVRVSKAELNSLKERVQRTVQSTALTDSVKSSLHLLNVENDELKEEKCSLQKALSHTKDLFSASEECKSLVLQELENVKKSKDEMSASMEDLKLLNTLLKKQLGNNENAIKDMEKVWKELEEVKTNHDSEKESWDKQRKELEDQVQDLKVRLKEAAELYKKQFLEIRNLRKQLKSRQSSGRKLSDDETASSGGERIRCSSSDSVPSSLPSLDGSQNVSFMSQSLSSLSDSGSKTETSQFELVSHSRCNELISKNLSLLTHSPVEEVIPAKTSAPTEQTASYSSKPPLSYKEAEMLLAEVETSANCDAFKAHKEYSKDLQFPAFIQPERAVPALAPHEMFKFRDSSVIFPSSGSNTSMQGQKSSHSSDALSDEMNGLLQPEAEAYDLPCPICDAMITVYGNNTDIMGAHLLKVHNQQLCPVCGRMFDKGLPSNYFKYHVENHFAETHPKE